MQTEALFENIAIRIQEENKSLKIYLYCCSLVY
jgi:hypothetical protein